MEAEACAVRQLLQSEGKTARNLVAWSVPAVEQQTRRRIGAAWRRKRRGRGRTVKDGAEESQGRGYAAAERHSGAPPRARASRVDLRARYWSFLFDNFHRAVDELYCTCETDDSVAECQEVLLSLQRCTKDFEQLIRRIELQKTFEKFRQQDRPPSLAWEVRKTTSPSKQLQHAADHRSLPAIQRAPQKGEETGKQQTPQKGKGTDRQRAPQNSRRAPQKGEGTVAPQKGEGTEAPQKEEVTGAPQKGEVTGAPQKGEGTGSRPAPQKGEETGSHQSPKKEKRTSLALAEPLSPEVGTDRRCVSGAISAGAGSDGIAEGAGLGEGLVVLTWADRVRGSMAAGRLRPDRPPREAPPTSPGTPPTSPEEASEGGAQPRLCTDGSGSARASSPAPDPGLSWSDIVAEYDAAAASRQCWADRSESPTALELPRSPGRSANLHQRLSSPSRKRPVEESRRIFEEKQAKAHEQRSRLQEEITLRSKVETDKVRGVRESQDARVQLRRAEMEGRLQRAEMLRSSALQDKIRKAQKEDAKVSEIAFINALEAQNKRIEVMERHQGQEARLQDIKEERQRKREEQLAKEEAAQERRRFLEAERAAKLEELRQRRQEHDAKVEQMRLERERVREQSAQEKARERERRREARNTALLLSAEELERRIQMKLDESSRRYGQQLDQRRATASTTASTRLSSVEEPPRVEAYGVHKWCTLCGVRIVSEVYLQSHVKGAKHQAALASRAAGQGEAPVITEASEEQGAGRPGGEAARERRQAGKRRAKKLRQRMASRAREHPALSLLTPPDPTVRSRLQRAIRELSHAPQLSPRLDKTLAELLRCLVSPPPSPAAGGCPPSRPAELQLCFCALGGPACILRLLLTQTQTALPLRAFQLAVDVLEACCHGNEATSCHLILSNKFSALVDVLVQALAAAEDGLASAARLCSLVTTLLVGGASEGWREGGVGSLQLQALSDCVSYVVSVGVVELAWGVLRAVRGPLREGGEGGRVSGLVAMLEGLTACLLPPAGTDVFAPQQPDHTLLSTTFQHTEMMALPQLLYTLLLHSGPPRHSSTPPPLSPHTLTITSSAVRTLNNAALIHLPSLQSCLGAEGISLEFRHVISYLLWYCSHHEQPGLLHELILAVGYFCVLHPDNQEFLQSGRSPTLLQLLCALPFEYFSNPALSQLLYPTLIAACFRRPENRAVLEQELSSQLLLTFLRENLRGQGASLPHRPPLPGSTVPSPPPSCRSVWPDHPATALPTSMLARGNLVLLPVTFCIHWLVCIHLLLPNTNWESCHYNYYRQK